MRIAIVAILAATPVSAWEFSPSPVCTLSHQTENAEIRVTHDPRQIEPYAISLARRQAAWSDAPTFAMRFDGPRRQSISTSRHVLSDENKTLTVRDKGFGNVLNGLARNHFAIAILGKDTLAIPLAGAAPEVERFRRCAEATGV